MCIADIENWRLPPVGPPAWLLSVPAGTTKCRRHPQYRVIRPLKGDCATCVYLWRAAIKIRSGTIAY